MSFQGVQFSPEMRKMVVNVKTFFDKQRKNPKILEKSASVLAAKSLGVSESTVKTIMAAFRKTGDDGLIWDNSKNRGRPPYSIEAGIEPIVRKFIRDANKNGCRVTLEIVQTYLERELSCKVVQSTLWRALVRWGFEFGTGTRSAQLKESERIIIQRRRYLREKRANYKPDGTLRRPEVYLDESYINKNHSCDNTWYSIEDGSILGKPTGKGTRLIIVNAITREGWVPNTKLVFEAAKKTGDYHSSMNWNNFSKWFKEQLLENIPENSLIILDNAAYHNVLVEEAFPKKSHSVSKLREWLTHNEIPWEKDMLKAELFDLCSRFAPKPEYLLDRMASDRGHSILRTPPYHPELQPIETCWAVVKNHVANYNDCTMESVRRLLEEGFEKVTMRTLRRIFKEVKKQEDMYWREDSDSIQNDA